MVLLLLLLLLLFVLDVVAVAAAIAIVIVPLGSIVGILTITLGPVTSQPFTSCKWS